jgi:hypothetical protein
MDDCSTKTTMADLLSAETPPAHMTDSGLDDSRHAKPGLPRGSGESRSIDPENVGTQSATLDIEYVYAVKH